jgi:hypothetical protein
MGKAYGELAQGAEEADAFLGALRCQVGLVQGSREEAERVVQESGGRRVVGVALAPELEILAAELWAHILVIVQSGPCSKARTLRDDSIELKGRPEARADFLEVLDFERGAASSVQLEDLYLLRHGLAKKRPRAP